MAEPVADTCGDYVVIAEREVNRYTYLTGRA